MFFLRVCGAPVSSFHIKDFHDFPSLFCICLFGGSGADRAGVKAAWPRLGAGLSAGGHPHRANIPFRRRGNARCAARCRIWRGDDAVPYRARTGAGDAVEAARQTVWPWRLAGTDDDSGNSRLRHAAGTTVASGARCWLRPGAVIHRDSVADPRREGLARQSGRTIRVFRAALSGYRRHSNAGAIADACLARADRTRRES